MRALDVSVVVEGSVRRAGAGFRIAARVLSVADGFQIWSQRFDRPASELLAVNDELASAVAAALTTGSVAPARHAALDAPAIDAYLRARGQLRHFYFDSAAMQQIIADLEAALTRHPDDPTLTATLAHAMMRLSRVITVDRDARDRRALVVAERAVMLAPHTGDAWVALAGVRLNARDLSGAVRALKQCVASGAATPVAYCMLGTQLAECDRLAEADRYQVAALTLDRSHHVALIERARYAALAGDWDRVEAFLSVEPQLAVDRVIHHAARQRLAIWRAAAKGEPVQLPPEDALVEELRRRGSHPMLDYLQAVREGIERGRFTPTEASGGAIDRAGRAVAIWGQLVSEVQATLGDREGALAAIERAVVGSLTDLTWFDRCPALRSLHDEPRFLAARATVAVRAAALAAAYDEP
jgi:serine/threonine-protein kinase